MGKGLEKPSVFETYRMISSKDRSTVPPPNAVTNHSKPNSRRRGPQVRDGPQGRGEPRFERPRGPPPPYEDLVAAGYTKRQAAWISPDPEKHKHFLQKMSRKERGSYAMDAVREEFLAYLDRIPALPNVPLYNVREVVPEIAQPYSPLLTAMKAAMASNPGMSVLDAAMAVGINLPSPQQQPPSETAVDNAEPVLLWESRLVLVQAAVGEEHPANKKAKCSVFLRALGRRHGLSDQGLERIAEICGPRYEPKTGIVTLTSERYLDRESNRRHILGMIDDLVEEGKKVDLARNKT
jgi:hypothetical protein